MVEIHHPGNNRLKPVLKVDDEIRRTWPKEYERFKQGLDQRIEGIPLSEVNWLRPSRLAELHAVGMKTVEQLAAVSDGELKALGMDARELRTKAQAHIKPVDENVRVLQSENAALKNEMQELRARLDAMSEGRKK